MNKQKLINVNGRGPVVRKRQGRFEVSVWRWTKIIPPAPGFQDLFCEREELVQRISIRYRQGQAIWCSDGDLRDLARAIDELNE